ncbi:MAG TPA: ABC-type transport auxiliary lipoprotein family protein [Xanthomonadales bacterium]|nr:ABC-type transport auxiliary lipoprotein family protein [Xanthomonadales bacterium]
MHRFNNLPLYCVLLSCGLLTACSGLLESGKPARQVYMLHSPPVKASAGESSPGETLILSLRAVPGLDTDQVLVLGSDARLIPAANARWADNLPEVVTSITRRYLSDTREFKAVRVGSIARPGEWFAEVELQAFYGTQGAGGTTTGVELKMEIMLRCNGAQKVVRITQQAYTPGDTLASLVAAHQQVLDAAVKELPALILDNCRT